MNEFIESLAKFALKIHRDAVNEVIMDDFDDGKQSGVIHTVDLFMYKLLGQTEWEKRKKENNDT